MISSPLVTLSFGPIQLTSPLVVVVLSNTHFYTHFHRQCRKRRREEKNFVSRADWRVWENASRTDKRVDHTTSRVVGGDSRLNWACIFSHRLIRQHKNRINSVRFKPPTCRVALIFGSWSFFLSFLSRFWRKSSNLLYSSGEVSLETSRTLIDFLF